MNSKIFKVWLSTFKKWIAYCVVVNGRMQMHKVSLVFIKVNQESQSQWFIAKAKKRQAATNKEYPKSKNNENE